MHYGYLPEHDIDHISRDRQDNHIENLRHVSRQCNLRNASMRTDNTSGVTGVSWNKKLDKWNAQIFVNGKRFFLGNHEDFEEAVAHRLAAEQCLNWSDCHSETPAAKYMRRHYA